MAEPLLQPGRTAVVCGIGVAGASAARVLLGRGLRVVLTAAAPAPALAALTGAGAIWAGPLAEVPAGTDLLVASPGFRPHDPLLTDAARAGVAVWGEAELAWRLRAPGAAPWLALTGTNGKTTTVHMLASILRAAGLDAPAVGNVGVAMIEAAVQRHDVLAVELSSQQLHFAPSVRPFAGALLNLAPDHLDWHGSMRAYADAKAGILRGGIAIGNADDPAVARLLAAAPAPRRVGFTLGEPGPGQLGLSDGMLVDAAFAERPEPLVAAAQVRPGGSHNIANALAAAALARARGVDAAAVASGLRSFVPDPHRNQLLTSVGGIAWVDDSKATNPHAARASLTAYPRVVWVAGGQLKGAPVEDLVREVAVRLRAVVLLGQDRAVIAAALRRHAPDVPVIEVARTDDGAMSEAVRAAAGFARPGDTVLLAPAAASYDMFSGYPARGAAFAAAARALPRP